MSERALTALGCGLALALVACGGSSAVKPQPSPPPTAAARSKFITDVEQASVRYDLTDDELVSFERSVCGAARVDVHQVDSTIRAFGARPRIAASIPYDDIRILAITAGRDVCPRDLDRIVRAEVAEARRL